MGVFFIVFEVNVRCVVKESRGVLLVFGYKGIANFLFVTM